MTFLLELEDSLRVFLCENSQLLDAQRVNIAVIDGIASQSMLRLRGTGPGTAVMAV